ncbi:multidrug effflux MFS transporter [Marinomonas balearica]|uniref:Bcr/CflA family efflux transporter n=1 Tax=Marinomonas balearica TaxID=491947 RepID=A0A4R6MCF7_9GAMM|nr:multidrug effflux MFS transporter [Marinomonas balearica]TDO98835.1 DHA1 family bicyclomycin/chloramphenicol resistance-like MFS transporter [Marinomonas balearica]
MSTETDKVGFYKVAIILGLLSAIGPFAIDMYLPALPKIGQTFMVGIQDVQLSLTAFLIAQGVSQLFYGPISDKVGRKPPLYVGMGIFLLATIGCVYAASLEMLIAFRFLQGIGAAAGIVVARAIVRDLYRGIDATKMMSLLMLVFGVSPILAPLVGSSVIALSGWRTVFVIIAICAALGLILIYFGLNESYSREKREAVPHQGSTLGSYLVLLKDSQYMGIVLASSFALANFFVFLANSPFVLIEHYQLTETQYGLAFGLNAAVFFCSAQMNARLCQKFGIENIIKGGIWVSTLTMATMAFGYLAGLDSLFFFMGLYMIASASVALVIPTTSIMAMENHGHIAGTASALLGTLQIAVGPTFVALLGPYMDSEPLPMILAMTFCSLISLIFVMITLTRKSQLVKAA